MPGVTVGRIAREGVRTRAGTEQMGGSDSLQAEEGDWEGYCTGGAIAREQGDVRTMQNSDYITLDGAVRA